MTVRPRMGEGFAVGSGPYRSNNSVNEGIVSSGSRTITEAGRATTSTASSCASFQKTQLAGS